MTTHIPTRRRATISLELLSTQFQGLTATPDRVRSQGLPNSTLTPIGPRAVCTMNRWQSILQIDASRARLATPMSDPRSPRYTARKKDPVFASYFVFSTCHSTATCLNIPSPSFLTHSPHWTSTFMCVYSSLWSSCTSTFG